MLNNDSGRSACYDSLCINTSKLMTHFHDFPMPEHYPMYCSHQQVSAPMLPEEWCQCDLKTLYHLAHQHHCGLS